MPLIPSGTLDHFALPSTLVKKKSHSLSVHMLNPHILIFALISSTVYILFPVFPKTEQMCL